jgi:thioredoxin 1
MLVHGNKDNFDSLISDGVVVVDFFANWCGPCRMLGPVLEELSNSRSEVKVIKIDVDQEEDLARRFGVMSIPALYLFKDGKQVDNKVGFMPLDELEEWINK